MQIDIKHVSCVPIVSILKIVVYNNFSCTKMIQNGQGNKLISCKRTKLGQLGLVVVNYIFC